jgi:hypothetical protein
MVANTIIYHSTFSTTVVDDTLNRETHFHMVGKRLLMVTIRFTIFVLASYSISSISMVVGLGKLSNRRSIAQYR